MSPIGASPGRVVVSHAFVHAICRRLRRANHPGLVPIAHLQLGDDPPDMHRCARRPMLGRSWLRTGRGDGQHIDRQWLRTGIAQRATRCGAHVHHPARVQRAGDLHHLRII